MHVGKKKTSIIVISICLICLVLLVLFLATNIAINFNLFDSGGCISVALDKSRMADADKIIIRVNERQYEITDYDVIQKIVSETTVATNTDLRFPNTDRWIDVYRDDVLIRSMRWADNNDQIIVYSRDGLHWIFPSLEGYGIVYPSEDLLKTLVSIINADK